MLLQFIDRTLLMNYAQLNATENDRLLIGKIKMSLYCVHINITQVSASLALKSKRFRITEELNEMIKIFIQKSIDSDEYAKHVISFSAIGVRI